jgi:hypothetical protein
MNTTTPVQLDIAKQAFQESRDNLPKVGKLPSYLWETVKPSMDEHPISMVSHSQLKWRELQA